MAVKGNKMPLTALFYKRTPRHAAARRGERGRKISDSEGRIAEAVHQRVDVLAGLAHGAVAAVEAGVVGQAGGVEDRGDRDAQTLVGGGEDGRQARHGAAVVVDRDRKSTRLNSSHPLSSRMPSSA